MKIIEVFIISILLLTCINVFGKEIDKRKDLYLDIENTDYVYEGTSTYYGMVGRYNADWPSDEACKVWVHKTKADGQDREVCIGKSLLDDFGSDFLLYSHNLGLLQWDTSSIPLDKFIYDVKIRIYVSNKTVDPYRLNTWDENEIALYFSDIEPKHELSSYYYAAGAPLEYDAVDVNDRLRYDVIYGEEYGETPNFLEAGDGWYPTENQWFELSKSAVKDLQTNLNRGWFGLGIDVILKDFGDEDYASGIILYGGRSVLQVTYGDTAVAPEKPTRPSGENEIIIGTEYGYTTSATDPQGKDIYYIWDWGDGSDDEEIGPFHSGETCFARHTWNKEISSYIRVKVRNVEGYESDWSAPLNYATPKNRLLIHKLFDLKEIFSLLSKTPIFRFLD